MGRICADLCWMIGERVKGGFINGGRRTDIYRQAQSEAVEERAETGQLGVAVGRQHTIEILTVELGRPAAIVYNLLTPTLTWIGKEAVVSMCRGWAFPSPIWATARARPFLP